ncbi:Las1-domain-containing protein, partial [Suhomyces tanzawaensis NRRL Y-17324]
KNPTVVPYKSSQELLLLKEWFYNFTPETDNRFRAVQRVKAIASRGRVPHGVEATSFLTLVCLLDNGTVDSNCVQLAYAMALIRFVNGLIDPFQQSHYATPMHHIAKTLGLPTFFVELRHMGTHESLPSLELCRIACHRALNWLYDNYWIHVEDEELYYVDYQVSASGENGETPVFRQQYAKKCDAVQLVSNMKTYKKLRKVNLDADHKPVGTKQNVVFWKTVKNIKKVVSLPPFIQHKTFNSFNGSDLLVEELVFHNFLIYNAEKIHDKEKLKFNPLLIKLYKPLLNELGPDVMLKIAFRMLHACKDYFESADSSISMNQISHSFEAVQMLEWASFLKVEHKTFPGSTTIKTKSELLEYILDEVIATFNKNKNENLEVYSKIIASLESDLKSPKIDAFSRKVKYIRDFQKFQAPSLDELLGSKRKTEGDHEGIKKQKGGQQYFLFEKHKNWTPVPFG